MCGFFLAYLDGVFELISGHLTDIWPAGIMLSDAFTQAFFICIWKKIRVKEPFNKI